MKHRRNAFKRKGLLFLLCCTALLSACASPPKHKLIPLQWPEPPLKTRIEFVKTLASEGDMGHEASFMEQLMAVLTGQKMKQRHLFQPVDIVVSDDGTRVYVSDYGQFQVFIFDLKNKDLSFRGPFDRPFGIALDHQENLYVAEQGSAVIRVLDVTGKTVNTIRHPELVRPTDLAIDRRRALLYVADPARKRDEKHTVKVFDLSGTYLREVGKGKGEAPGQLHFPTYLNLDRSGNLYVSSTMNARIDVFSPEGRYLKSIGERGNTFGKFDKPKGIALDSFGHLYVVDSNWSNVQIFNQQGEVLLYFGGRGAYPGLLKNPTGIAIDHQNRIYVADLLNDRIGVYQLKNTQAEEQTSVEKQISGARPFTNVETLSTRKEK